MFVCLNCHKNIPEQAYGTQHRNHCPFCLFSVHLDDVPGDRSSSCHGLMEPVALTFKKEGVDKYGREKQGEIMLVHQCKECKHISINRIAGDDDVDSIISIIDKKTVPLPEHIVATKDKEKIMRQLLGSPLSNEE